jgi:DNA transformation protein
MGKLSELPNISTVTENKLNEVGIDSPEQLINLGSKAAFIRIRTKDPTACLHMLYGLEGAVQGIRDKFLSSETKEDLKAFFKSL